MPGKNNGRNQMTLQPIATAPMDGSFVLVAGDSGYVTTPLRFSACYCGTDGLWRNHAGDLFTDGGEKPLWWAPLPEVLNNEGEAAEKITGNRDQLVPIGEDGVYF